jgi:hypothetical protein
MDRIFNPGPSQDTSPSNHLRSSSSSSALVPVSPTSSSGPLSLSLDRIHARAIPQLYRFLDCLLAGPASERERLWSDATLVAEPWSSSMSLPKLPSERLSSLLLPAGIYSRSENAIKYLGFLRTSAAGNTKTIARVCQWISVSARTCRSILCSGTTASVQSTDTHALKNRRKQTCTTTQQHINAHTQSTHIHMHVTTHRHELTRTHTHTHTHSHRENNAFLGR